MTRQSSVRVRQRPFVALCVTVVVGFLLMVAFLRDNEDAVSIGSVSLLVGFLIGLKALDLDARKRSKRMHDSE